LKIKLHLLPEREVRVMIPTTPRMKVKPTGLQSLSPRQLAFLYHVGQGKSRTEAASLMGVTPNCLGGDAPAIGERLGLGAVQDAARIASPRINAVFPTLPIGLPKHRAQQTSGEQPLSPTLMEVFPLLASGATTKEVAHITGLEETTWRAAGPGSWR